MNPNILILTPTLGERRSLTKTVSSIKEIGGEQVKHILVAPISQHKKLKEGYPDLDIIAEPVSKKGIYPALNEGFNTYAKDYQYIGFLNDDDYWLPNFKLLIEAINNDSSLDFVYGKTYHIDQWGRILKEQTCSNQFNNAFLPLLIQNRLALLTQQATLVKSKYFFHLGGFSEKFQLISDSKFWADLSLLKPKYKYINKVCAAYTSQKGQLSSDKMLLDKEYQQFLLIYSSIHPIKQYSIATFRLTNWKVYIRNYIIYKIFHKTI
jgi:glycosyltransferase involved in cell wall biosynthesis